MRMSGHEVRSLRKIAGLTQAELAAKVGLSRKSINEAEALGDAFVEPRTEFAVTALTLAAKARARLLAEAEQHQATGNDEAAKLSKDAAVFLTGNFATDENTIYNLARTAAIYRRQLGLVGP